MHQSKTNYFLFLSIHGIFFQYLIGFAIIAISIMIVCFVASESSFAWPMIVYFSILILPFIPLTNLVLLFQNIYLNYRIQVPLVTILMSFEYFVISNIYDYKYVLILGYYPIFMLSILANLMIFDFLKSFFHSAFRINNKMLLTISVNNKSTQFQCLGSSIIIIIGLFIQYRLLYKYF